MAWFKVDDGWWSHPKTLQLSDSSVSLWTRAGSWSCQHLTDGFIPKESLKTLGGTPKFAAELVRVDYWEKVDGGWVFHDWAEYQEHSDVVKKRRNDARERMHAVRANRTRTKPEQNAKFAGSSLNPDPTRPDPTPLKEKTLVQPAVELIRDFEMLWEVYPRKQAKVDALKAYTAVRKKVDAKTILAGAQAYALLNIGVDKSLIKMAGGWLRGERWADEQIVNATRQTVVSSERFCELHPDYPVSARYPCEACTRSVGLSDGREF